MRQIDLGLDIDTNTLKKFNVCHSTIMVIWINHHLSNICSSIQEKVKQHRLSWKKALFVKKKAFT